MGGGGGFINDISDAIGGFAKEISNVTTPILETANKAVQDVTNFVVKDVTFNTYATIFETVGLNGIGKEFRNVGNVVAAPLTTIENWAFKATENPKSLITDRNGNFSIEKTISLAMAVVMAIPTGGMSLAAYAIVSSGATFAMTMEMAKAGWVDYQVAAIMAVGMNLLVTMVGFTAGNASQAFQSVLGTMYSTLTAVGVSVETATAIVTFLAESYGMLSSMFSLAKIGIAINDVYNAYMNYIALEKSYRDALAAFEAWKKSFDKKDAETTKEINDYASCNIYRYYAGQDLFNIGLASRERYIPFAVQEPSYGIFNQPQHNEDILVARMMFDNKTFDMPGGTSFMYNQMDGTMVKLN